MSTLGGPLLGYKPQEDPNAIYQSFASWPHDGTHKTKDLSECSNLTGNGPKVMIYFSVVFCVDDRVPAVTINKAKEAGLNHQARSN